MFELLPKYYHEVYFYAVVVLVVVTVQRLMAMRQETLIANSSKGFPMGALILCLIFWWFWGTRPVDKAFVDTLNYAVIYDVMKADPDFESGYDVGFDYIMRSCINLDMPKSTWFAINNMLHIIPLFLGIMRLYRSEATYVVPFFFAAFTFVGYAFNGIRFGISASFFIWGLSYLPKQSRNLIMATLLMIISVSFHKSILLPIVGLGVAMTTIKNFNVALLIWLLSVALSVIFPSGTFESFMMDMVDDRRADMYLSSNSWMAVERSRYRWDFLLYSTWPIVFGYYVANIRKVKDPFYNTLLIGYMLTNAVWVMINRAAFSNRFADLSWFLYPILLSYPYFKFKLCQKQGMACAVMLGSVMMFTGVMWLLGRY